MIEILSTGAVNTVQDLGRRGYLDVGVGRSGTMDAPALEVANRLAGNEPGAAGIEVALFPFRVKFHADTVFAVTGANCPVTLNGQTLPSWWAAEAKSGDTLTIGLPSAGARVTLAFRGGIDLPEVLGSRATDLKSGFGGLEGRGLNRGDRLTLGPFSAAPLRIKGGYGVDPAVLTAPVAGYPGICLRVMPSAEHDVFTDDARQAFYGTGWTVTNEANRMGYRLSGPGLALTRKLELFSHGIMPGTIQVPPSGQPIIQLAEANTCGGYPKIANIIEADLWRMAQVPVGAEIRFVPVSLDAAIEALRQQRAVLTEIAKMSALMLKLT
ncbi:biotin-dependent carboxyltransferase family protein [Pararhizobium sp.]|uniref:5-oxoprolinase subunit C family protein n=1 Tax=Pararhizobium sp. TaxID=1977563 RepID=UPI002719A7AB|nr:biotin-dependent carboxyltransferase family protein [Pararhizobium sp.]MDO9416390.1 biotin-dependent carboxyltransferase family protein [Pararhizobium sp.]